MPKPNVWTELYDRDIEHLTDERDAALAEVERLREALMQCQNTDDEYVYRVAGNALAGRPWHAR